MVTLTTEDSRWLRNLIAGAQPDETTLTKVNTLLTGDTDPEDETDSGYPMTQRCYCNQADDTRVSSHQRGDTRFCRDTTEAAHH